MSLVKDEFVDALVLYESRAPATSRYPLGVWWQLAVSWHMTMGCLPGQYLEENLTVKLITRQPGSKKLSPLLISFQVQLGGWNPGLTLLCCPAPLSSRGADEKRVGLSRLVRSDC